MPPVATPPQPKKKMNIALDIKTIIIFLLVIALGVALFMWKPWQPNIKANERTVTVTGDATLSAVPDQYVFSPSYDFENADKQVALGAMSTKSDEIVTKLKALGVTDKDIQTNSSGYNKGIYYPVQSDNGSSTYTLNMTVTVTDKDLAQKVQDYLVTTSPSGEVSPQASFSDAKTKTLQTQARNQATQDARSKADQSAKNLGFKVAAVKSVTDGSGFQTPYPCSGGVVCPLDVEQGAASTKSSSLSVQPGENKLSYSVTVVYYIR